MSNAIRFDADAVGFRLDPAAARRQFWISLGAGLAVLAVAAMFACGPTRAAPDAPSVRHAQISAPEFVARPAGIARLRQAMAAGANSSAD